MIERFVALGFGASIVPAIAVQDELDAGTPIAHRVLPRSQHRRLGAIYSDRSELLPPDATAIEPGSPSYARRDDSIRRAVSALPHTPVVVRDAGAGLCE